MSHNKVKIGTAEPDIGGNIAPSLSDLSNVSISSPQSGHSLVYNGSSWETGAISGSTSYIFIWEGASDDYSNTGNSGNISVGNKWYLYDSSPQNTISGSTINKVSGTHWVETVTLPAGTYVFEAQFNCVLSATGGLTLALYTSTGSRLSANAFIGDSLASSTPSSTISASVEITSTMVSNNQNLIQLQVITASNVAGYTGSPSQGNTPSEFNLLYIRKVS